MKSLFYVLALITGLAASYFSHNNSKKHEEQTKLTKEVDGQNVFLETEIRELDKNVKKDTESLAGLRKDLSLTNANIDESESEVGLEERSLKQIVADLKRVRQEIEEKNKFVAEVEDAFAAEGVKFDEVGQYLEDLQAEQKELTTSYSELEANIETSEEKLVKNNGRIGDFEEKKAKRLQRMRSNAAEASVAAVNHDWGFVVVDLGNDFLVTTESELLVKRGSNMIGRLKLNAIEPGRIICDIDYASMVPGVAVQVGDKIFHGKPATR